MNCVKHPDREGIHVVDLPSIGVKRYLCQECADSLCGNLMANPRFVPSWEKELRQGHEDRRVDMLDAYPSEGLKWKNDSQR